MRIPYISLVAAGALALGGCAYGDLGYGLGYGGGYYDYGYGSPYYGASYGSSYYGGYGYGSPYYGGYGMGSPYFGWYDNYYYPGTGYYVYDVNRRPYRMSSTQRSYWSSRSPALRTSSVTTRTVRPNWSAFDHRTTTNTTREERRRHRYDNGG